MSVDGIARNANSRVYNNLIYGCRVGILDYAENVTEHGLKNAIIANNTIITDTHNYTISNPFGILLRDNGTSSINSYIVNNIVYSSNGTPVMGYQGDTGPTGVTINNNLYYSASSSPFRVGYNATDRLVDFAGWKTALTGHDTQSSFANPLLVGVSQIVSGGLIDYLKASLTSTSTAINTGTSTISSTVLDDILLLLRPQGGSYDIGAFEYP